MLNLLTKYLLQYRKVCIPHVGTFEIIQQGAEVNFINKQILPPSYEASLNAGENLTQHQLDFLSGALHRNEEDIKNELTHLGQSIQQQMAVGNFSWNGIGSFHAIGNRVKLDISSLQVMAAEKIQRKNPDHAILIGDHQTTALQSSKKLVEPKQKKRSTVIVFAWILLIASLLFIGYLIVSSGFSIYSSGLQSAP